MAPCLRHGVQWEFRDFPQFRAGLIRDVTTVITRRLSTRCCLDLLSEVVVSVNTCRFGIARAGRQRQGEEQREKGDMFKLKDGLLPRCVALRCVAEPACLVNEEQTNSSGQASRSLFRSCVSRIGGL